MLQPIKKNRFGLWLLLAWLAPATLLAQTNPEAKFSGKLDKPLPLDPAVKMGKLPNGLTYYIRKNPKPEKRVELRLAVNAGSMQEEVGQEGLAHFTEHMAFNGTKNFPKNELVSYLESVGVRFGNDLNAYTSFDETVYILPIPTDKPDVLAKGFQVLADWAGGLAFDGKEIDKERGVIIEEWRMGQGAGQRMRDKYFPILFKNSRYAERLPIGKKEVIEGFAHDKIKQFYKDWYRPDLMAVAVVGDIDVAETEKAIQQYFGQLPAAKNPRPKTNYEVPDHAETLVAIVTDKEATNVQGQVIYKQPSTELKTEGDLRANLVRQLYNSMLNARLDELRQKADPPFVFGFSGYSGYVRTKDAYFANVVTSETGLERGLKTVLEESERVKRFGFTATELDRAKKNLLNGIQRQFNERSKTESENYVDEYVEMYLEGAAAPGIEFEYQFANTYVPTIGLDEINVLPKKWMTEQNRVVIITAPDKETVKLPTEARVRELLAEVAKADLKPYEDKVVNTNLMTARPAAGKVTAEKVMDKIGVTEWTLSNGARVVFKPTDFKNDEVLFSAYSFGGSSLYPDADVLNTANLNQIIGASGVGQLAATDLTKALAGRTVRVSPSVNELTESLNGNAAPKDLEALFQLVHLYFTQPRQDAEAFQSFVSKGKQQMKFMSANPQFYFLDQAQKTLYNNNPRRKVLPDTADFDKIDLARVFQIYRERFANAGDFTFMFVGNCKPEQLRPLVETYLASLPGSPAKENFKDLGIRPLKGMHDKAFFKGSDQKSLVNLMFMGEAPYSRQESYYLSSTLSLLNIKLIESIREEQSGAYSVGGYGGLNKNPYNSFSVQINIPCAATRVDTLTQVALSQIEKLQAEGPTAADLQKIKETQKREREVSLKENRFWLNQLASYYQTGDDPNGLLLGDAAIDALTAQNIQAAAKKYFNTKSYVRMVLKPEATEASKNGK
ncbi:MAG: insulinase family protein [Bernardetiaceae bacterium]|jgi:zinc protease|nr:insulinase family protein [Bernardetiaceae bacterium]